MVSLNRRRVEVNEGEVIVDGFAYKREIDALQIPDGASPQDYALLFREGEANSALSMRQQLNGLAFDPMVRKSFELGLPLITPGDFTPFYRDVNLALDGEGVLYHASGNLIEGKTLTEVGQAVNNAWIYLNGAYEKSKPGDKGFLGLDILHVTGFDGEKPIFERQPLEEGIVGCYADVRGEINNQGSYTEKAKVQKFERGKTVYVHQPVEGSVAGFSADPDRADLYLNRNPLFAYRSLGGILRAEGTAQKIGGSE